MNRTESYQAIISKKKGINEIPYQKEFLVNNEEFPKPFVLAGGTSSGKTITTAIWIEMFYQNPLNKGKKTLLIPASTTVLRDNMGDTFDIFKPDFNYCVCRNKEDLKSSIESDCDVILCLPQTLVGSISELNHFHNFILDEAHQWYFKTTITDIIKRIKPKNQLLLTGTPSKFVAKGNKFDFTFVPVMDLYDLELVSNVTIKVVSSTYNPSQSDYTSTYGNLSDKFVIGEKDNSKSLKMVCKEMISKLGSNSLKLSSNPYSVLGEIDKTIIFCHSQKQANQFYKILNATKGLEGNVLVSHSKVDRDSVLFSQFKSDNTKKVLIAVNRGKLGFSMGELFNIIDFTLTQNIDMLLQMYGRVLRLSKHNRDKQKTYYKVATKDTAEYFVNLMKGMLCLTNMKYYSTYNGKNMGGMLIQNIVNDKVRTKSTTKRNKSKSVKQNISIEELGIPLDLSFLKNISSYTDSHKFATVAVCTLDEVRKEFFGIKERPQISLKKVKEDISKCSTQKEFRIKYSSSYNWCKYNNRNDLYQNLTTFREVITEEKVREAILKYSTIKEFISNYPNYYKWLLARKKLDWVQHLSRAKHPPISEQDVRVAISKCSTLKEFKGYNIHYRWILRNKRTDLIQHFNLGSRFEPALTEERVIDIISKCSTLKEFRDNHPKVLGWCRRHHKTDLYQHLTKMRDIKK
jgi:superfamily II DNA or RNA helicase